MCLSANEEGGPKRCAAHARAARDQARRAAEAAHAEVAALEDALADAERHYASDGAFRNALKQRIRDVANATGEAHEKVARRFVLQQLLLRLNDDDPDGWVLTGGTALQFRTEEARTTMDADLATKIEGEHIENRLTEAITRRPGERGDFTVTVRRRLSGVAGYRANIVYTLGGTRFANADIDIITSRELPNDAAWITPQPVIAINDSVPTGRVRVYPSADHIADKVGAMYQTYGSSGTEPSTRPHDLADLVILSRSSTVDAAELHQKLSDEADRRHITLPQQLEVPSQQWAHTWKERVVGPRLPDEVDTVDRALVAAREFIDPILSGKVTAGQWDPTTRTWRTPKR